MVKARGTALAEGAKRTALGDPGDDGARLDLELTWPGFTSTVVYCRRIWDGIVAVVALLTKWRRDDDESGDMVSMYRAYANASTTMVLSGE